MFDTLLKTSERHTLNDEYENFGTVYTEGAAECILTKLSSMGVNCSWEKQDNMKKASSLNKRNQINANA